MSERLGIVTADDKHCWLEVGQVVIDITADQFGKEPVIVSPDSNWHRSLVVQKETPFDESKHEILLTDWRAEFTRKTYDKIKQLITTNSSPW